jgi:hypothetical protein
MKHLSEEELVLIYYREPGAGRDALDHLAKCAECRAAAESLARTLNLCNDWTPPEPEPDFGRSAWARLAPALSRPARPWPRVPVWIAVAAMALLGVFFAGRASRRAEPALTAGLSERARDRILAISLADHLDRTQMLLMEVSNASELSSQRLRAQDLVDEGRLMRQMLEGRGEGATLALMDDVERFLMELANAPESLSGEQVRQLRERIGSESLLFKVRIIESNLRTEGQKS